MEAQQNCGNTIICSTCNTIKNKDMMRKNRNQCLECKKDTSNRYYTKNRENILKKRKNRYRSGLSVHFRNQELVKNYKNKPCVDCNVLHPFYVTDLDHTIWKDKKFNLSKAGSRATEAILNEINKCEVRCANCHRDKTYKELKRKSNKGQYAKEREVIQNRINEMKNKPCTDCGLFFRPWQMDFDHTDAETKLTNIGSLLRITHDFNTILNEINNVI